MPRVKRRNHSAQMNSKRWCSDSVNTCVTEENIFDPNIRINQLLSTEKTGHSEVGNFISVNFKQISKLFMKLKCPDCDKQTLKLALGNKVGFSYVLNLTCSSCAENVCTVETSNERQGNTVPDINLRITQAFSNIGKGYSAIEKFSMAVIVYPFSSRTYSKCIKLLHTAYCIAAATLQSEVHREVRKAYEAPTDVPVVDISVSYDGSWLIRGHTSLIDIACVIDILTGYVIDFEVMCKVCRNCSVAKRELGESSAEYDIWFEGHRKDCDVNHYGSSTSMEMEAALILWERSQEMGFRYSTLLSDGDCKTFNYLTEKNVYGDKFEIKNEECINHVSKRLGTGLRNAVKESRARGISLGGKGHGTLKEATIKKLTLYYQKAIVQNKGNVPAMKKAIYATLHYSISTDQKTSACEMSNRC
ncbi:uncharacterized protein TNCV_3174051 [Trichonephila clavipes]|nr:uncharacterized protein TNCV_3174051 [Trichonephila clavipes]